MKHIKFDKGVFVKTLPCGNQCYQDIYADVSREDAYCYITELGRINHAQIQATILNDNIFACIIGEDEIINLTYLKHDSSLTILHDPLIETDYLYNDIFHTKITETTLAVIPLDYSHREITDAHGMCFIITLEDGRYIVIDGGYGNYEKNGASRSSLDSQIIYQYLHRHKKRAGKITIAAWIFTHPHPDHYSAFIKFNELYSDVDIQSFVYNNGDFSTYSTIHPLNSFLSDELPCIIKRSYPNAKIIKPHTAQGLKFCNVTLTAIYTQELAIPYFKPIINNTSLVFRMRVKNTTVLFMADCDIEATELITRIYQGSIKSDIMQVNHHGYSGATINLYDCVNPDYTIWPTSKKAFKLRVSGEKYQFIGNAIESNKYIFDKLGKEKCIVADDKITYIVFNDDGYYITQ